MKSPSETRFQLALLPETTDQTQGLSDTESIEWLLCKQSGDYLFEFYKGDALVSSINLENPRFDLQDLLAIIVVGSVDAFEAVKSNWRSRLPSARLTFSRVPKCDSNAILFAAMDCIADELRTQRQHSGRTALELVTYRREFDRLQDAFSRLEEFVSRQSLQAATEIFEYPAASAVATINSGRRQPDDISGEIGRSLIQPLPVDSLGVSSFSVHISALPQATAQPLRIQLKAVETGKILEAWSIGPVDASVGWVELALNYAIGESALSLAIIIEWPSDANGWALTLGPPHPYKEFGACTGADEYLGAPLAVRVFSTLPGVRVPATTTAIRPINAQRAPTEFIPYELYETVAQVFPPSRDDRPTLVSYDRDIGCITVHPRKGGLMTVARLTLVVPKHAWRVSAQIYLAHEQASLTLFGLMVCAPGDESRELALIDQLDAPSQTFSGWKSLSALENRNISALLAPTQDERLSIYLVTRQAPDASPDFGWARFSKFQFNILPNALVGENQSAESIPNVPSTALGREPHAKSV